jgi:hypothetical protein
VGKPTDPPGVIIRVADGVYLPPGARFPVAVTDSEDAVLLAFLLHPAMHSEDLVDQSAVPHAARVLARLETKYGGAFRAAIWRPGRRDAGGYAVLVRNQGPTPLRQLSSSRPAQPGSRKSSWSHGPRCDP